MDNVKYVNVGGVTYELRKDLSEKVTALEGKVFPLTISVSGGGTFEKGVPKTITVSWTVKKGDDVVTADSVTVMMNLQVEQASSLQMCQLLQLML